VVIVGGDVREEVEPCSDEDLLEPLKARIPFPMLDGADGAARRTCSLGQLYLGKSGQLAGLHHECGREGRHPPTDAGILLVVVSNVTEIGMDGSHISDVPDPRREVPGASYWPESVRLGRPRLQSLDIWSDGALFLGQSVTPRAAPNPGYLELVETLSMT
jgi:hypothetical protein